jgi:phage FluMu gp28-like protein
MTGRNEQLATSRSPMILSPIQLLCPYQLAWLRDAAPLAIGEKSRRIGWTWTQALAVVLMLADRPADRPLSYWHSSADMTASSEFIRDAADWAALSNKVAVASGAPEFVDEERDVSAHVLRFANGSKIVAGSSNPKFFRSKGGPAGLDEFAFHRDGRELYKAAHATALFWGHPLRIWSTHNGPGSYFAHLLADAKTGKLKASLHKVTIEDAVEQGIVERIDYRSKRLDYIPAPDARRRQEWLDELRATCPDEDTWNEEYLCIPSTDAASLLTYDLIQTCEPRAGEPLDLAEDPADLEGGAVMYAGFDVGRKQDRSALWVLKKVGDVFVTRMLRVLERMNFTAQEDVLHALMANRSVKRLCIDETGLGMQMAERLRGKWGYRVEPVTFTAPAKAELAMPLRRLFEDRLVRVPSDPSVREDLHKVRKVVTAAGNVRLDAARDESGHADRFWALALAYHAADDNKRPLPAPLARKPVGW